MAAAMNYPLRIRGLVRFAKQLRESLPECSDPGYWQTATRRALSTVNKALQQHGLQADDLPAPTRRAYHYLRKVDFGATPTTTNNVAKASTKSSPRTAARPTTMRLPGIQGQLDTLLDELSHCSSDELTAIGEQITAVSERTERAIANKQATPAQLTDRTRAARGWFGHFALPENLLRYARARDLARDCFTAVADDAGLSRTDVSVHFRPMGGLYRLYTHRDHYELRLPTEMIALTRADFRVLSQQALGVGRQRQRLLAALNSPAIQSLQARIEVLEGSIETHQGLSHDLQQSFDRVNETYFNTSMVPPRLCWSKRPTRRKLGHYDVLRDTVMISRTLDTGQVPEAALDFVMYHELLHKHHGIRWQSGRAHAHTPAFRHDEQRYPDKAALIVYSRTDPWRLHRGPYRSHPSTSTGLPASRLSIAA